MYANPTMMEMADGMKMRRMLEIMPAALTAYITPVLSIRYLILWIANALHFLFVSFFWCYKNFNADLIFQSFQM